MYKIAQKMHAPQHIAEQEQQCLTTGVDIDGANSQRRILFFSDGTLEERDTDSNSDDDDELANDIDEHDMAFVPRLAHKAYKLSISLLAGIDYVGGGLASFLGITTPKYASEIEYYKECMEKAAQEQQATDDEMNAFAAHKLQREVSLSDVIIEEPRIKTSEQ